MSAVPKDKPQRKDKRMGKAPSEGGHGLKAKDVTSRPKDSISTASYMDDLGHHDDNPRMAVSMENTYQLGPSKGFSVREVRHILKDVLTSYLQEEKYEVEWARQMTKTLCEVIRARVKELTRAVSHGEEDREEARVKESGEGVKEKVYTSARYKIVVQVHIGQLTGQGMQISSRCLWDAVTDTFVSYSFKNSSLFGVANFFAVYFE